MLTERLDVNLVVGFGCYKDPFLTELALGLELDELVELYRRQATDGIGGSRVRAGLFGEVGTSLDEITPLEELHLRAVARAHLQTGLAISTHCTLGTMAVEQAMILGEEGADLSRVVLGHLDLRPDPAYLEQVLATGVNIAFDTFGKERFDYQLPGQALKQTFHRPDTDRVRRARRAHRTWAQRPDRDLDGHDGARGVLQPDDARRPRLRLPPRRRHPAAARRRSRRTRRSTACSSRTRHASSLSHDDRDLDERERGDAGRCRGDRRDPRPVVGGHVSGRSQPPSADREREVWAARHRDAGRRAPHARCRADGRVVGFVHLGPSPDADHDPGSTGHIFSIHVDPDVVGTGIGRASDGRRDAPACAPTASCSPRCGSSSTTSGLDASTRSSAGGPMA